MTTPTVNSLASFMLTFKKDDVLKLVDAIPPASELQLVHDDGVYIMSFAQAVGARTIVYATGCNPKTDADYYDTAHALVGGDDFGECIGTAQEMKQLLKGAKSSFKVALTESAITCTPD